MKGGEEQRGKGLEGRKRRRARKKWGSDSGKGREGPGGPRNGSLWALSGQFRVARKADAQVAALGEGVVVHGLRRGREEKFESVVRKRNVEGGARRVSGRPVAPAGLRRSA